MTDLSTVQVEVLHCLRDNNGDSTFDDLAVELNTVSSPQGIGRAVASLLKLGYVSTYKDYDDKHSVELTNTAPYVTGKWGPE